MRVDPSLSLAQASALAQKYSTGSGAPPPPPAYASPPLSAPTAAAASGPAVAVGQPSELSGA